MEEDIQEIMQDEDDSLTADKCLWDQGMTFCLIEEYRNHLQDFLYPQSQKIKDIWERISLNMHAKGYGVSAGSCDQKWRQLKKTFRCNKINEARGKKSKVKWIYYEALEDILNKKEIVKRTKWKQRSTIIQEPESSPEYPQAESLDDEDTSSYTATNMKETSSLNHTKEEKPPKWFEHFLTQYQQEEERKRKMLQKMHSDLVALEKQKCVLLENLIKKIPKPEPIPKIIGAVSLSQEAFEESDKLQYTFNGV